MDRVMIRKKDQLHSTRVYPFKPKGVDERAHITLDKNTSKSYNTYMRRFDSKYWVIDYNALMVATIIPLGERSFKVPAQWRTNADFLGVRWISEDTYSHPYFKYATENDYRNMILAFRANPPEPDKFTITITADGEPYTYRLAPYALVDGKYKCLDTVYGTKKEYRATIIDAPETIIPDSEMEEAYGRKDYIFILDFSDLRTQQSFTGPKVNPRNISMLSFDCVEHTHGLGKNTFVADMVDLGNNEIQISLGGANTNAVLTAGDKLQMIWRFTVPNLPGFYSREDQFVVKSFTGFGSGSLTAICEGTLENRTFIGADAFYGRYLQSGTPVEVLNTTKYFTDFKMNGGIQRIRKRHYPQPVNGMGMTYGFDDGYNLTPERVVEQCINLGYRKDWTTYIGMSHYFNGYTAFQDKVTGEIIRDATDTTMSVLFAGQSNAAVHFLAGDLPNRGADALQRKLAEEFGVGIGSILPINGATGSTAADRMCAVNPNSTVFDPDQTHGAGGLWWWDLEAAAPGPALLHCVQQMQGRVPKVVIWAQGGQDVSAIMYPDTRFPVPSVARTKLATERVFEYMRNLWGSDLKIVIQQLTMGWALSDPANPTLPISPGMPTNLESHLNSWGDVVFKWKSYKDDPAGYNYFVDVYHPTNTAQVMTTISVPGTQITDDGFIFADWPIEQNVQHAIAVYGDQFPWGFLRWRVRRSDNPNVRSSIHQSTMSADDEAFGVKVVVGCGINSLIGGYFNDLSDPLNPGGTGKPGRKDVVAASTFRKQYAANAGLRDVEVVPVMLVVGSSPINPMPYQEGFPADNYWWDPVNKVPGPNLIYATNIVNQLKKPLTHFIESGPGETTGISFAPLAQRPAILAAFKQSNIEMLAWMRANWGNPNLDIWFQGATSSFWGTTIPPLETNFHGAKMLRDVQTDIARTAPGFRFGSYVPNSNLYTTYANEMAQGLGWIHYTVDGYHAAAAEMGKNMALNNSIHDSPPWWAQIGVPENLQVGRKVNGDNVYKWDGTSTSYRLRLINPGTGAVLREIDVTGKEWTYTEAQQIADFGNSVSYTEFHVAERVVNDVGSYAVFVGSVYSPELGDVTSLKAIRVLNGDIKFTWTGPVGTSNYWVVNRSMNDNSVLSQQLVTDATWLFTMAAQEAAYGPGGAGFFYTEFYTYDPVGQYVGPQAVLSGSPEVAQTPINAAATKNAVTKDVTMVWDALDGAEWIVSEYNVSNGTIFRTRTVNIAQIVMTLQDQIDEYGFDVGFVQWDVRAVRADGAVSPVANFSSVV